MFSSSQWQFLAHDEGEKDVETDPNWVEDEGINHVLFLFHSQLIS